MRYRELVARISEVTRTLVDHGNEGEFEPDSTKFRTGSALLLTVKSGLVLEILEGSASGHYIISEVNQGAGVLTLEGDEFPARESKLSWVIYEPGVAEKDVRKVLRMFPEVIMECEEGEQVRTYLGTFRMTRRKRKRVKDPQGRWTHSEERIFARIRPGKRLQRDVEDVPSGFSILSAEALDEDP
jgi:nucleoid DNA-binding protein